MTRTLPFSIAFAAAAALSALAPGTPHGAAPALHAQAAPQPGRTAFALNIGDHICIIGNQLAERMQYEGWLDTLLHARFPQHDLVIRNLGFSGDEIATRLRSKNFGSPDEWLSGIGETIGGYQENRLKGANTKADVVFAFFGYNESYGGDAGLSPFRQQLDEWITHTLAQKYNGKSAPRIVLFSPIAHEDLHNPDLPDGRENNARLELYTLAMSQVAAARGVSFVNLFAPTRTLFGTTKTPLTVDGVHLNPEGNRAVAEIIDRELFGAPPRVYSRTYLSALQKAVADKSFQWFNRYRTTDGFATFGDRAFLTFIRNNPRDVNPERVKFEKEDKLPTNYEVLEREVEVLDYLTANRDQEIWRIARGAAPGTPQIKAGDLDTPKFIDAGTNEPGTGPNGAHIYLGGEEAIAKMKVGTGFKVELFASEKEFPELVNPVQIAFDTRGRLWVAAWKNYPHWQPKTPMDDKLLILEDTNGDGKADKRTVFAGDLNNPTGFEFWNGGVIVAQAPNLVFLKDTNGDDKYDTKEILLGGMDSADTHHTMNSFTFDPGGALYIREGIFHRSQVETPWGPTVRQADGGVFRFEPRTFKFETYIPMNFPNPHGHTFDYWGRDIIFDATGGQPYYGPSMSTKKYYPAMESTKAPRPGQVRTRPVGGSELLSGSQFPDDMQGNLIVLNTIGFQGLLNYKITEDGAGLKMTEVEPIIESSDQNFRPVDAEIGADGALYVADWSNALIGHMQHNLRDTSRDHEHGRIYRVTYPGRPAPKPAAIAGAPIAQLLDLLKLRDNRTRYRAKIELSARNTNEVLAAVTTWIAGLDKSSPDYEHQMMEALWVQQWHNRVDDALLKRMLRSSEPWARVAATRVLCYWRDRVPDALALLKVQANDDHPAVRLEAVRAASFFRTADAVALAQDVARHPQDRFLEYASAQAMNTLNSVLGKGTAPAATAAPADTPAAALPDLSASAMRRDLRDKGVQIIQIGTVPEQMRYDVRWFVVEAGKPVQLVLTNPDAMPHNIVIGKPGSTKEIGTLAATMPPPADVNARAYIPESPLVLQATKLVQRGESETLKFMAPSAPGSYDFVCSFPGHWVRMYGVMLVVPSLDAFETKPTPPTDPLTGQPYGAQR
jgi:glucose/arabinose dehydrogenase/azurin/lysophospholipase L1-like esterase